MAAYKADGTSLNYNDTAFGLTALKHQYTWLKEADSIALQQALRNLDKAYDSRMVDSPNSSLPNIAAKLIQPLTKTVRLLYLIILSGYQKPVPLKPRYIENLFLTGN